MESTNTASRKSSIAEPKTALTELFVYGLALLTVFASAKRANVSFFADTSRLFFVRFENITDKPTTIKTNGRINFVIFTLNSILDKNATPATIKISPDMTDEFER